MSFSRRAASLVLGPVFAAGALLCASPSAAEDDSSSVNVIEFKTQVSSDKGVVRCGLFKRKGWLKTAVQPSIAAIHGRSALCVFKKIPAGEYGLSAFHDENNNGKLDTNIVGYPVEDYCASRGARGTFGPPSFEDAKFAYKGGTKRIEARMK